MSHRVSTRNTRLTTNETTQNLEAPIRISKPQTIAPLPHCGRGRGPVAYARNGVVIARSGATKQSRPDSIYRAGDCFAALAMTSTEGLREERRPLSRCACRERGPVVAETTHFLSALKCRRGARRG